MDRPRVFGIGLSRTGTQSLATALQVLGYRVKHWPMHMWDIHASEACTDISVSCRFEFLDSLYPGSRFVYTERDLDSWLLSCERWWRRNNRPQLDDPQQGGYAATEREYEWLIYGAWEFGRERFAEAYRRHERRVLEYFAERPGDLLRLNIAAGQGWDRLLPFLGFQSVPFPHENKGPVGGGLA